MLIISIILASVTLVLLAKRKPRGRSMTKYIKGVVDENLSVGTLAARTLVAQQFDETPQEEMWATSIVASYSLSDVTPGANIGPLLVGIAHSDYTDTEIEEYIENTGSWAVGDQIAQERNKRKIRIVGTFRWTALAGIGDAALNEGMPIKTKLGWNIITGQSLDVWVYNLGSAAFATTVPEVHVEGHVNLWRT